MSNNEHLRQSQELEAAAAMLIDRVQHLVERINNARGTPGAPDPEVVEYHRYRVINERFDGLCRKYLDALIY